MMEITNAMCEAAERDYYHEYINAQIATAQENNQSNLVLGLTIPIWTGYKPEVYVLLLQSKGFHVEFWEETEYSPERLYIGW